MIGKIIDISYEVLYIQYRKGYMYISLMVWKTNCEHDNVSAMHTVFCARSSRWDNVQDPNKQSRMIFKKHDIGVSEKVSVQRWM